MTHRVLLEASGTLISAFLIKSVQQTGAVAIASDIEECAAKYFADEFIIFPRVREPRLWEITEELLLQYRIDVVIPTLDETLLEWSKRKQYFKDKGTRIIVSDSAALQVCQDKWETFLFFQKYGIPCPQSSLLYEFPVVKPRNGRGGSGILYNPSPETVKMEGMISQEWLKGKEYTIDVFCDNDGDPVYIVPRIRQLVRDGKSTAGITVEHKEIDIQVNAICRALKFTGPINIQCFETPEGEIKFTEINPRMGGGTALGCAASENFVSLIFSHTIGGKPIQKVPVKFGMKMFRFYNEVFV